MIKGVKKKKTYIFNYKKKKGGYYNYNRRKKHKLLINKGEIITGKVARKIEKYYEFKKIKIFYWKKLTDPLVYFKFFQMYAMRWKLKNKIKRNFTFNWGLKRKEKICYYFWLSLIISNNKDINLTKKQKKKKKKREQILNIIKDKFCMINIILNNDRNQFLNYSHLNGNVIKNYSCGFYYKKSLRRSKFGFESLIENSKYDFVNSIKYSKSIFLIKINYIYRKYRVLKLLKDLFLNSEYNIKYIRFRLCKPHNGMRKRKPKRK